MKKTKKKSIRRFLALVLALVVWVSSVPTSTFAAEADHVHNEDGWTCEQMESSEALVCEMEEHQHSDVCYEETSGELICENEAEEHEHTDECYTSATPELACDQAEHTHTDDCYEIIDGEWNCIKAEDVLESGEQQPEEQQPEEKAETYTLSFSVEGVGNVAVQIGGESIDLSAVKDVAKEDEVSFKLLPEENTEVKSVSASGAEVEKLEGSEDEYAVRNVMSDEVVVSIEVGETIVDEMEVPEAVQAFLDAVSQIPAEITAENAEVVAELLYGLVSDTYEALLGTKYESREDVQAAVVVMAAAIEKLNLLTDLKPISYVNRPSDVQIVTITQFNEQLNDLYAGSVTKKVGDVITYDYCPTDSANCSKCGNLLVECVPDYYAFRNPISRESPEGVAEYKDYSVRYFPNTDYPGLSFTYDAKKPGKTRMQLAVYHRYKSFYANGYCDYCGKYAEVYNDEYYYGKAHWYGRYIYLDSTVKADYALNYDTDGGSSINPTTTSAAETQATLMVTNQIPTREGYTFLGWAENPEATEAQYKGGAEIILNWSEGLGSTDNPVSKTLYAVWEKIDTSKKTTYTVVREYYINGEMIATVTIADKAGKVGDEIIGATLAKENPNWSSRTVDGEKCEFTFDGSNPEILTLVEAAGENIITLMYVKDEEEIEDTTYTVNREYYINDEKVETVPGTPQEGKVGDEIIGAILAEGNPGWNYCTVDEKEYEFTFDGSDPEILTLVEAADDNIITLKYVKDEKKKEDTTYTVNREYYINDEKVETVPGTPQEGKVGDEIIGATLAEGNPGWSYCTVDEKEYEFTFDSSNPESLTLVETADENIITLKYILKTTPEATATPAPTATPGATATPAPTATPGATATPAPTATPGVTATPEPTATPGATATPEPTVTPGATATPAPTTPTEPTSPTTPTEPEVPTPPQPPVIEVVPEVPEVVTPESPDVLVVIPDEDIARAVVYERVQNPVTEELSYEVNEEVPVLEEVPEVVEEESPDTVIILDEDVPQSYVKVQDPVTEDYVYIPEEDVPLASIGTPQTGDIANGNLWMTLFMVSFSGMAILVSDSKRRKRNH